MSQNVDVAWWVRPAIEHTQDALFWWVRPEGRALFHALFLVGPLLVQHFMLFFITSVFCCCLSYVFFSKIKLFVSGLFFDFLVFCSFVFRLKSSLQKINLSSFKLVLIQFRYRGFSFLSHAVRLWFMVFSKLALVSLDFYIILCNRVKGKFETC